jgi:hypothetical protein
MPVKDRFEMYVDKSGDCWEWTGYKSKKGYGVFNATSPATSAHRFAFQAFIGEIPESAEVDHRCLNRGCVRPDHLRLTTRKQNMENRAGASIASGSGIRGVHYRKDIGKWHAYVVHHGRNYFLGYHETAEAADAAATAKRLELFTHNELDRLNS